MVETPRSNDNVFGSAIEPSELEALRAENHRLQREIEQLTSMRGSDVDLIRRAKHWLDAVDDGVFDLDIATGQLFWSDFILDMLGITDSENLRREDEFFDRLHGEDRAEVKRCFEDTLQFDTPHNLHYRLRRDDGRYLWVHARGHVLRDDDGTPVRFAGVMRDVSDEVDTVRTLSFQKRWFSAVYDEAPYALILTDHDAQIVAVNPQACLLFGYEEHEIIGLQMVDLFHSSSDYKALVPQLRFATATDKNLNINQTYRRKDGVPFIGQVSMRAVHDDADELIGYVTAIQDVTRREHDADALKQSENRFRDFAESSSDWLYEQDEDLRFTYLSANFSTTTGYPISEFIGKTRAEVYEEFCGELDESWHAHLKTLKAHEDFDSFGYVFTRPNGERRRVVISGKAIFDDRGNFRGYRGLGSDVTQDFENLVALEQAKNAAEMANEAKSEFLSTVSHELRTPVAAIKGALGLISGGVLCAQPKKMNEVVELAERNCTRLSELIDDILDAEKSQSGKLHFSFAPANLCTIVSEAIDHNQPHATRHQVSLKLGPLPDGDVMVKADSHRLHQVMNNLLSNAAKFSEPNSEVLVTLDCDDASARINVIDQGRGISPEFLPFLFDPFAQASQSDAKESGGTGLGLTITRHIVQKHAGDLSVTSEPGSGSTFTVTLPLSA